MNQNLFLIAALILASTQLMAVEDKLIGKWQAVERVCSKMEKAIPLQSPMSFDIQEDGFAIAQIGEKNINYMIKTFPAANAMAVVAENGGGFRYSYDIQGDTLLLSSYTFRDNPTGCPADNFQTTAYKRQ